MSSLCPAALQSLDDSLALLCESVEKLKAAKSVDIAEVIEQLKIAAESARIVRESVSSELPEASWQNGEELDALIEKIQKSLHARALEQLRSRLLTLATELESGSIVHRRAHRLNELNQLRDQAINELRFQAGLEREPQTLPGPQANQWIEWACGLKEPHDAESLQILRNGFPHLDDFVANLEPNMWIAGSLTMEALPEPEKSADKTQQEAFAIPLAEPFPPVEAPHFPQMHDVLEQISELEAAKYSGGRDVTPDIRTGVEQPWGGKWRMLLATAAVLVLAALGSIQWRSHRNQADLHPSLPQVTPKSVQALPAVVTNALNVQPPIASAPAGSAIVSFGFDPPTLDPAVGATFTVNLNLAGGQNVYAVPLQVLYNPRVLQLLNVSNGPLLSKDGQTVALVHRDDSIAGILNLTASRPSGSGGISGDGAVFTLTFQARAPGSATLSINRAMVKNASMENVPASGSQAIVTVHHLANR